MGEQKTNEAAAIKAAHPTRSGRHDLYQEAMRLVGERHAKGDLVDLVTWLLDRAEAAEKRVAELEGIAAKERATANKYLTDWYDAKAEFGTAMGKMRRRVDTLETNLGAAIEHLVDLGADNTLPVYMADLRAALRKP